jgi:hypothetical protein
MRKSGAGVFQASWSRASGAEMTLSMRAASATVRVIGPQCDRTVNAEGGDWGTSPKLGLIPKTPQKEAGMRIEPAPSVPE